MGTLNSGVCGLPLPSITPICTGKFCLKSTLSCVLSSQPNRFSRDAVKRGSVVLACVRDCWGWPRQKLCASHPANFRPLERRAEWQ